MAETEIPYGVMAEQEAAELRRWHMDCYREAGFGRRDRELLELAGADPHDVVDLLASGCPHSLVLRILT